MTPRGRPVEHIEQSPAFRLPDPRLLMFPVGTVSDMIGPAPVRSRYCMVPTLRDGGPLMTRYGRTGAHIENVVYRGRCGWYVETEAFRRTQREHSCRRYGRPRVDKCLTLCAEASRLLTVPLRDRVDPLKARQAEDQDGRILLPESADESASKTSCLAYQWLQRWLREELVRLRVGAALWLLDNAEPEFERGLLLLDAVQLWEEASLTNWELTFAARVYGAVPVLEVKIDGYVVTVALPQLREEWAQARLVSDVRNTRTAPVTDSNEVTQRMEDTVARLWAFLPETPELATHGIGHKSYFYPHSQHIERNESGNAVNPWLKERLKTKRNVLHQISDSPTPRTHRKPRRDTRAKIMSSVRVDPDDDPFA